MGQVFYKLFYHVIWTTYLREPLITPEIEKYLYPFLINKAKRFNCEILGCNGTENHIHIAIVISPANSVSDIIGKLKGSSSYFLNKEMQITKDFLWQDGYGVLSFAERNMKNILWYIKNQKEHHKTNAINNLMEKYGDG
jgi:putative transposase